MAFLPDFQGISGQAEAWHSAAYGWFESSIESEQSSMKAQDGRSKEIVQVYNPAKFDPSGALVEQAIAWNAFPKELLRQYGADRALAEADRLFTLDHYSKALNDPIHFRSNNASTETPCRRASSLMRAFGFAGISIMGLAPLFSYRDG